MPPKSAAQPGTPPKLKQQTFMASMARGQQRKEQEQQGRVGHWQVLVTDNDACRLLETKFLETARGDVETYKEGSGLTTNPGDAAKHMLRRSKRKAARTEAAQPAAGPAAQESLDDLDSDDEERAEARSNRWEERGAAYVDVLYRHLSCHTALPPKQQEVLLHMVLNADHHRLEPNLSTAALRLLELNARLHPLTQQVPHQPHILRSNRRHLWTPEDSLASERTAYNAACGLMKDDHLHSADKIQFLLALLKGVRRHVRQSRGWEPREETPADVPGPVGLALVFQYVVTMLVQDYEVRDKVYWEYGSRVQGVKEGLMGDKAAVKVLAGSALAQLLSGLHNNTTRDWRDGAGRPGVRQQVVQALVSLVLECAPQGAMGAPMAATPATTRKQRKAAPTPAPQPSAAQAVLPCTACGALDAAQIGALSRQLLRYTYDLFLDLEEQGHALSESEQKILGNQGDTDCRYLADCLHKLLTRKEGNQELRTLLKDPCGTAILLSALSPRACLHLTSFVYAKNAAKRWANMTGEAKIPDNLIWLQPLRDYAEGHTPVREICEGGPARVDPIEMLHDLDREEVFGQCAKSLLSHTTGGEGFLTWLTTFTYAAAAAAQQGHVKLDLARLKDAYQKALTRVQQQQQGADSCGQRELRCHHRKSLAKLQLLLSA